MSDWYSNPSSATERHNRLALDALDKSKKDGLSLDEKKSLMFSTFTAIGEQIEEMRVEREKREEISNGGARSERSGWVPQALTLWREVSQGPPTERDLLLCALILEVAVSEREAIGGGEVKSDAWLMLIGFIVSMVIGWWIPKALYWAAGFGSVAGFLLGQRLARGRWFR